MIRPLALKLGMTPTSLLVSVAIHAVIIAAILGLSSGDAPANFSPDIPADRIDERDVIEISLEVLD